MDDEEKETNKSSDIIKEIINPKPYDFSAEQEPRKISKNLQKKSNIDELVYESKNKSFIKKERRGDVIFQEKFYEEINSFNGKIVPILHNRNY